MQTTYEDLFKFAFAAQQWLAKDERNPDTKLGYAIRRIFPRVEKLQQAYNNAREDIQIDCCSTDEKLVIVRDEKGGFRFTKDELKRRNREWQQLFESTIEIKPYVATETPDDLTDEEREAFAGFVIEHQTQAAEA